MLWRCKIYFYSLVPYFFVLLFFLLYFIFLVWGENRFDEKILGFFSLFPALCFILVFGFRYDVGVDFNSYLGYFNDQQIYSVGDIPYEVGFYYIIRFLRWLGFSFQSLFILTTTIQVILLIKITKAYDKVGFLILLLYFFCLNILVSLNTIRQSLSILFCILSVIRFYEGRYISDIPQLI